MMSMNSFGISRPNAPAISEKIVASTLNAIQQLLPENKIQQFCAEVQYSWRDRILPPAVAVLHMILAALWPEESFNASWEVQWAAVASRHPDLAGQSPSRGTVSKARKRLPLALWDKLFAYVSETAQAWGQAFAYWRGHRVVLVDGTCISMPAELALFEAFGVNTGYHGKGRYPLARVATLCLAGTMTVIAYALGSYCQSEWTLAVTIFGTLRRGDLLIADRYFAAAHYFWRYQSLGLEFLTRTHQCLIVSRIKRVQSYSRNDFLGWLTINKQYRKKDRTLPEHLLVRFVQATVRIRGTRQVIWLATSLLDAKEYPAVEIVQLYGRRWRIETAFEQLKVRLSADVLRSHSPDGIRKEFAARCIALNLVHSILLEAASLHHVDPMRISFAHAVRAILIFSPALACEPVWRLPQIYRALILEIAHHLVPERPGRLEPRAIRREHKHYPALAETRAEWRSRYAA
jgi:Transposase DDE domain